MRALLLLGLAACDPPEVERVSLASECARTARDTMVVTIDGRSLCARATLHAEPVRPDGSEGIIEPGSFDVFVTAQFQAGDATTHFLAVGVGSQTRRVHAEPVTGTVGPLRVRGPEKLPYYDETSAIANLWSTRPLELGGTPSTQSKTGSVTFDHYDLRTGISSGWFELESESVTPMVDTRRAIQVTGTFETATVPPEL